MPPSAWPHCPRLPLTSPNTWCNSTYAEPGVYGLAKLPTTASKPSAALIGSDSNQRSRMSPALLVNRSRTSRRCGHRQALEACRRPSTPGTARARRLRRSAASPAAARAARRRPDRASRSTPAALPRPCARIAPLRPACRRARRCRSRRQPSDSSLLRQAAGSSPSAARRSSSPCSASRRLVDHLRMQQADRVARGRVAESGMEFLGHRGAAEDRRAARTPRPSRPAPAR